MPETTSESGLDTAMSASWLSTKWGVDTIRINAMRRAGELIAFRPAGSHEWIYPVWQFDDEGGVKPDVQRVLETARARGIDTEKLNSILHRRSGMTSGGRLLDELLSGRVDHVVAVVRSA